jgi:hypothetical protein
VLDLFMTNPGETVNLAFVGDICLGLNIPDTVHKYGVDNLFDSVAPYLDQADIRVGNLECCLIDSTCSDSAQKQRMAVSFDTAEVLSKARFDALNIANNHILDCGPESIKVVQQYLRQRGIAYFGAGVNRAEAVKIAYMEVKGKVIALIGFSDTTEYYADHSKAGIAPMSRRLMAEQISKAKYSADLVIVSLHADLEFGYYPSTWRVRLSRWLVEQGAHLVIQHHPHVVQGIEPYLHGLIAYSLGNFVFSIDGFSYMEDRRGVKDSIILQVSAEFIEKEPRLKWKIVPVGIDQLGRPRILDGEKAKQIRQQLHQLSKELLDKRLMRQAWFTRCCEEAKYQGVGLYWEMRKSGVKTMLKRLYTIIRMPGHRRWMRGLLSFGWW